MPYALGPQCIGSRYLWVSFRCHRKPIPTLWTQDLKLMRSEIHRGRPDCSLPPLPGDKVRHPSGPKTVKTVWCSPFSLRLPKCYVWGAISETHTILRHRHLIQHILHFFPKHHMQDPNGKKSVRMENNVFNWLCAIPVPREVGWVKGGGQLPKIPTGLRWRTTSQLGAMSV